MWCISNDICNPRRICILVLGMRIIFLTLFMNKELLYQGPAGKIQTIQTIYTFASYITERLSQIYNFTQKDLGVFKLASLYASRLESNCGLIPYNINVDAAGYYIQTLSGWNKFQRY